MKALDRLALSMIVLAGLLLWFAVPAPFLHWTMLGSVALALRAQLSRRRELFIPAIVMPVFVLLRAPLSSLVTLATPHTIDAALLSTDFGISATAYSWFASHPAAYDVIRLTYFDALPFWIALVMAFAEKPLRLMQLMVLATVAAVPLYLLFPAVGPVWVGTLDAPRNCMPSLHMTWALLAWWHAPKKLRIAAGIFAGLTALATLATGEHYVIDLVAAVPFTALVGWISGKLPAKAPGGELERHTEFATLAVQP